MAETQHTRRRGVSRAERWPGARSQILQGLHATVKTRSYCLSVMGNHWRFSATLWFPSPMTPKGVAWTKLIFSKITLALWGEKTLWAKHRRRTVRSLLNRFRREMKIVWIRVVKVDAERHGGIQNTFWKLSWHAVDRLHTRYKKMKSQGRYIDSGPEQFGNWCGGLGH